jgi:GT2 family glycosyltransferase
MRLLVAIVNYRTPELTINCLRSLEPEVRALGHTRVVVADNDSGDGSVERIRQALTEHGWSEWASLREMERNGGFAYGNNAIIAPALAATDCPPPDYVLLLNSDTEVCAGALGALLAFMDAHPEVGIAGSRVEDADGTRQHSRYRFHSVWSEFDSGLRIGLVTRLLSKRVIAPPLVDTAHVTDWVVGASMIVRRQVFEDIGLLDQGYFLYFEEADFCLNARRAGWSCWYVPTSRIVHLVGMSSGITNPLDPPRRRPRYWFASRHRYFQKNHGRAYALCADAAWVTGFALWRVRRILQHKPDTDPPRMLWDFLRFRLRPGTSGRAGQPRQRSSVGPGLLLMLAVPCAQRDMSAPAPHDPGACAPELLTHEARTQPSPRGRLALAEELEEELDRWIQAAKP